MKKILSLILAFAFIFTLTACGEKAPTWQEQYDLGIKYLNDGNYEEAIIAFTAAIEIEERAEFFIGRGKAFSIIETEENFAKAEEDFRKAISIDNKNREAYIDLANVLMASVSPFDVIDFLEDALLNLGEDEEISNKIAEIKAGDTLGYSDFNNVPRGRWESMLSDSKWYHLYSYKDAASQSGEVITSYDENGNKTGTIEYEYIKKPDGNMIAKNSYWCDLSDGIIKNKALEFDENYNIIKSTCYSENNEIVSYEINEYDSNNNLLKQTAYDHDGNVMYENVYQ